MLSEKVGMMSEAALVAVLSEISENARERLTPGPRDRLRAALRALDGPHSPRDYLVDELRAAAQAVLDADGRALLAHAEALKAEASAVFLGAVEHGGPIDEAPTYNVTLCDEHRRRANAAERERDALRFEKERMLDRLRKYAARGGPDAAYNLRCLIADIEAGRL